MQLQTLFNNENLPNYSIHGNTLKQHRSKYTKAVYNGTELDSGGLDWWTDIKIDFKLPNNLWSCVETCPVAICQSFCK